MSVLTFPCNGPQRIMLPKPNRDTIEPKEYAIIFPREEVPVLTADSAPGADADGNFPINAVYVPAVGMQADNCQDAVIFSGCELRTCAVYLNRVSYIGGTVDDTARTTVLYSIKCAASGVNSPVYYGQFTVAAGVDAPPGTVGPRGLLAAVSVPGTQFEFWAHVDEESRNAVPVIVHLQFVVDDMSSTFAAYRGPADDGGGPLPIF